MYFDAATAVITVVHTIIGVAYSSADVAGYTPSTCPADSVLTIDNCGSMVQTDCDGYVGAC